MSRSRHPARTRCGGGALHTVQRVAAARTGQRAEQGRPSLQGIYAILARLPAACGRNNATEQSQRNAAAAAHHRIVGYCRSGAGAGSAMACGLAGELASRRDRRSPAAAGVLPVGPRPLPAMARLSRPAWHHALIALFTFLVRSAHGKPSGLCRIIRSAPRVRTPAGNRSADPATRLAGIRPSRAATLSAYQRRTAQPAFSQSSLESERRITAGLAARPYWHSHRRCRHAPAVANWLVHNRVRMITASFLVKNCRIHWQQGARWFWDTLTDANLANTSLNWQRIAGCGAGAAPVQPQIKTGVPGQKI